MGDLDRGSREMSGQTVRHTQLITLDRRSERCRMDFVTVGEVPRNTEVFMPSHLSVASVSRAARLLGAIAFAMTIPSFLTAQGNGRIRGRVTDAEDKAPLP